MNEVLSALSTAPPAIEEGVLNSFLVNARRLIFDGMVSLLLLAPITEVSASVPFSQDICIVELVSKSQDLESEHVNELIKRLDNFLELKAGWNNDSKSKKISKKTIDFIKSAIKKSDPYIWQQWTAFPDQSGSVLLDYNSNCCKSCISVDEEGFTFIAFGEEFYDTAERFVLQEEDLLCFVNKVREYES